MSIKPTVLEVSKVVGSLTELISFFPSTLEAKTIIVTEIYNFVGTVEQLEWFKGACIRQMTKWEGVPTLRAIFCTRYAPADGLPATVELPGYSSDEQEARFRLREMEDNDRRMLEYRRQALLAPPEDREPFLLPPAKAPPEPEPGAIVKFDRDRGGSGIIRKPKPSLIEREQRLAAELAMAPARSQEERDRLAREIEEKMQTGARGSELAPVAQERVRTDS
jgi:signal transduction histidine kinase